MTTPHDAARHPWRALPLLALICAGLFALVATAVLQGWTAGFDRAILLSLRVPGEPATMLGPHYMKVLMRDTTALGGTGVIYVVTFAVAGFLFLTGKRREAVMLLLVILGAQILSTGLKHLVDRPRPDLVPHGVDVTSPSFPSGHALRSAVLWLSLAGIVARYCSNRTVTVYAVAIALFLTGMVGISRVALGVHWPTDVLAGWSLGAAWALLCWWFTLRLAAVR